MEAPKILVVDDESRMRKLVKDFLGREGYQVLKRKISMYWKPEMVRRQWIFFMKKKI